MNEELKQRMREILLERFGVDIAEAIFRFSTQNYAFIFPNKPYMIRVSMSAKKTRGEILSELMWLDDLKPFKETICEPEASQDGKLLEEFEIDGITYRASMFRKARGTNKATMDMGPMFFICAGDLLGAIHAVSTNERELGIKYKRKTLAEQFANLKSEVMDRIPPEILPRINQLEEQVNALSDDVGKYGICHGDFHANNFFVDGNNIWIFDFDGCCYANYLYDIASLIQSCFLSGYQHGKDARQALYEDLLPNFRIGYEINKAYDEHYWDNLELMLSYRTAYAYMALFKIDECGVVDDLDAIKQYLGYLVSSDDVLSAITAAGKAQAQGAQVIA